MATKTKIEWCDYTINPVKGKCPVGCSYCYARRMYDRYKWNSEIRYDDWVWQTGPKIPSGSKIFVGSTIDLFHEKTIQYLPTILEYCESSPSRIFIFLTKCPHNLPKSFPDNCWVGVSVTSNGSMTNAYYGLADIQAKVRFISFEPLLGHIGMSDHVNIKEYLNWVIIGQQTPVSYRTSPRPEWIQNIIDAADKANIPVFIKNNILTDAKIHWDKGNWNRQEIPEKASS